MVNQIGKYKDIVLDKKHAVT